MSMRGTMTKSFNFGENLPTRRCDVCGIRAARNSCPKKGCRRRVCYQCTCHPIERKR